MDRRHKGRRLAGLLLPLVLLAAGCGGDDDAGSETTGESATTAESATTTVESTDSTSGATTTEAAATTADAPTTAVTSGAACEGEPVKFMVINNYEGPGQQFPEAAEGAKAAAAVANSSCALGRPIEILTCDDKFDPNAAAACGREAVAEGVIADIGSISGFGDSWMPPLAEAGIPAVGNVASSQAENTSPLSFPTVSPIAVVNGYVSGAASIGAQKVHIVSLDIPAVSFFIDLAKKQIGAVGMEDAGATLIPPTASDMTQYAAQALGSGADAIVCILGGDQNAPFLRALVQQGADLSELAVLSGATVISPTVVEELGDAAEGSWTVGPAWPVSDTTNTGIQQYLAELEAIGAESAPSDVGVNAWSSMHHVIDVLTGSATIDSATLVAALEAAGPVSRPELASFDFSAPAFPEDPVLSTLRIFSRDYMLSRVVDGELVPMVADFADVAETTTLLTP